MAFSEFADDMKQEELPQKFEGGNNKQRNKLNVIVKWITSAADSLHRRGGEDDGGAAGGAEILFETSVAGAHAEYYFTARPSDA